MLDGVGPHGSVAACSIASFSYMVVLSELVDLNTNLTASQLRFYPTESIDLLRNTHHSNTLSPLNSLCQYPHQTYPIPDIFHTRHLPYQTSPIPDISHTRHLPYPQDASPRQQYLPYGERITMDHESRDCHSWCFCYVARRELIGRAEVRCNEQ
jgi:hypothetical protein